MVAPPHRDAGVTPACTEFLRSSNPRTLTCCRCGRPDILHPEPEPDGTRPRDVHLERQLTDLAAKAAGFFDTLGRGDDGGLRDFADIRAWPGGVRVDLDPFQEVAEELADASSYALWGIEREYAKVLDGSDPEALDRYAMLLQGLSHLIAAWHAFRTVPQ